LRACGDPRKTAIGNHIFSIAPNLGSFAAIGANINVVSAFQDISPKINVLAIVPDLLEGHRFEVSQTMLCILVKTTGHYQSVPGDHGRMP
jgi:hypothetical protein